MSLATKYRPQVFDEVVEQTITTTILKKQIETKTFKNCYLFAGTSGCGKTTAARIFAKAINNGIGDPIEFDGGSMGSIDNIKLLLDAANQRSLTGEYKVIIVDECQNLGGGTNKAAWSALLKGLEDCPKYTIFIFCSTNPEKVPIAILNRLQRYNFAPISAKGIKSRLEYICQQEHFTNYEAVCDFISKAVHGGMRDAITYLEQVADYSTDLSLEVTKQILGGLSFETMFKLTWALQQKNEADIINIIESLYSTGQNLKNFIDVYLHFSIDLFKFTLFNDISCTDIPEYLASENNAVVQYTIGNVANRSYFKELADLLFNIKAAIKNDLDYKSTIIILLIQFIQN